MPIKIMYLMDNYHSPRAGTEGQILLLVQHLDRRKYLPAMAVLRSSDYIESHPLPCALQVLGIGRLSNLKSIWKMLCFGWTLRRNNYRLVHCFFNDVSLIGPPILRLFGIHVVVSRRDLGFWYTTHNLILLRLVAPFVDCYVANSHAVARTVQRQEQVPARKIAVIYNGHVPHAESSGTWCDVLKPYDLLADVIVIGIVANLRSIKRIDTLIEAFALVSRRYPEARLVIVGGDGPSQSGASMRQDLQNLAGCRGIAGQVVFTGSLADPTAAIQRFNVAVLCSESEGLSNSLIEYMQAGRPIVCTNTGGNPELIQDGVNGLLVEVGNADMLADRIIRLLSDPVLAQALGAAARETVQKMCSHSRMVSEQMACYDKLLANSQSRRGFYRALPRTR